MATMAKVPKSETVVVKVEIGGRKGVQTMIDSGADFSMWRRRGVPAGILVEAQEWEASTLDGASSVGPERCYVAGGTGGMRGHI